MSPRIWSLRRAGELEQLKKVRQLGGLEGVDGRDRSAVYQEFNEALVDDRLISNYYCWDAAE